MKLLKGCLAFFVYLLAIVVVVCVLLAIPLVLMLVFDWDFEPSMYVLGGAVLGLILLFVLHRWWIRRKEKKFVQQVIQQDEAELTKRPDHEREKARGLQQHWREAIAMLRRSHLKRGGNPLYALPWFLLLGEPGSGKSAAAQRSRLSAATAGGDSAQLTATQDVQWWFFDNAIVLDAAGRYVLGRDEAEWQVFLELLAKYRRQEPLNGVVVTVAADRLAEAHADSLASYGQSLRERINSLMEHLGHRFPVYLLVTKIDKVPGIAAMGELLPAEALEQCMGAMSRPGQTPEEAIESTLAQVVDQLRDLRLLLLHNHPRVRPDAVFFPDAMGTLAPGLKAVSRGLFSENPYQPTPFLRGIFFASAVQEGRAMPQVLQALGLPAEVKPAAPKGDRPMFLRDLFVQVLPRDRRLWTPLPEYLRRQAVPRNVLLMSWIVLVISVGIMLTAGWVQTRTTMEAYRREFRKPAYLDQEDVAGGYGERNLRMFFRFRNDIERLEDYNAALWWTRPLNFADTHFIERRLKYRFSEDFHKLVLSPLDLDLMLHARKIDAKTPDKVVGAYYEHLVRRINIARAASRGWSIEDKPLPSGQVLWALDRGYPREVARWLPELYQACVDWRTDRRIFAEHEEELLRTLVSLVEKDRIDSQTVALNWTEVWADDSGVPPVTLVDFWPLTGAMPADAPRIRPAHTLAGREKIFDLLEEYAEALNDPRLDEQGRERMAALLLSSIKAFRVQYNDRVFADWYAFAARFSEGRDRLRGIDQIGRTAQRCALLDGPYSRFLDRAWTELSEFLVADRDRPTWLQLVGQLRQIRLVKGRKTSLRVMKPLAGYWDKIEKKVTGAPGTMVKSLDAPEYFLEFREGLKSVRPKLDEQECKTAYENLKAGFEGRPPGAVPGAGALPVATPASEDEGGGYKAAADAFKILREELGTDSPEEQTVWTLQRGPLDFMLDYAILQTASHLQDKWETRVYNDVKNVPPTDMPKELFAKAGGKVWAFTREEAKPFLVKGEKTFIARTYFGHQVPFTGRFLRFLADGDRGKWGIQDSYTVEIRALPTDVLPIHLHKPVVDRPYLTVLTLRLTDKKTVLENYNYPASKTFAWTPGSGGEVELQIRFSTMTLRKIYGGDGGFVTFIGDFAGDGAHVFAAEDFPTYAESLKALNVDKILVKYRMSGYRPVLRLKDVYGLDIPQRIVHTPGEDEPAYYTAEELKKREAAQAPQAKLESGNGYTPQTDPAKLKVDPELPGVPPHPVQ